MQVVEVKEGTARCTAQGVFREVSTLLLAEPLAPGDFVMVHVGAALQKVDAAQAQAAWQTFSEIIKVLEGKADSVTLDFDTAAFLQAPLSAPYTPVATANSANGDDRA
jgi:hydrogenase expression/formation protein HypC